jgi:hypothetical protein
MAKQLKGLATSNLKSDLINSGENDRFRGNESRIKNQGQIGKDFRQ